MAPGASAAAVAVWLITLLSLATTRCSAVPSPAPTPQPTAAPTIRIARISFIFNGVTLAQASADSVVLGIRTAVASIFSPPLDLTYVGPVSVVSVSTTAEAARQQQQQQFSSLRALIGGTAVQVSLTISGPPGASASVANGLGPLNELSLSKALQVTMPRLATSSAFSADKLVVFFSVPTLAPTLHPASRGEQILNNQKAVIAISVCVSVAGAAIIYFAAKLCAVHRKKRAEALLEDDGRAVLATSLTKEKRSKKKGEEETYTYGLVGAGAGRDGESGTKRDGEVSSSSFFAGAFSQGPVYMDDAGELELVELPTAIGSIGDTCNSCATSPQILLSALSVIGGVGSGTEVSSPTVAKKKDRA